MRVAVIGAGSWGTTMAAIGCANADVVLWARRPELADRINSEHANPEYLPGFLLPEGLVATSEMERALDGVDLVVVGVPSHGYRAVLERARGLIAPSTPVVSLTKGIETDTGMRMSEVTLEVLEEPPTGGGGDPVRTQSCGGDNGGPAGRHRDRDGRHHGRSQDPTRLQHAQIPCLHQS